MFQVMLSTQNDDVNMELMLEEGRIRMEGWLYNQKDNIFTQIYCWMKWKK